MSSDTVPEAHDIGKPQACPLCAGTGNVLVAEDVLAEIAARAEELHVEEQRVLKRLFEVAASTARISSAKFGKRRIHKLAVEAQELLRDAARIWGARA